MIIYHSEERGLRGEGLTSQSVYLAHVSGISENHHVVGGHIVFVG